MSFFYRI